MSMQRGTYTALRALQDFNDPAGRVHKHNSHSGYR